MKNIIQTLKLKSKVLISLQAWLFLFCIIISVNAQDNYLANTQDEDLNLISKVPKHLPIEIEIINGKSEDILSDVEVKVTNTGEKPIYYLKFVIMTTKDFIDLNGNRFGFEMKYGRPNLVTFTELANETDVPIKKDESYTFRVNKREIKGFKQEVNRILQLEIPKKFLLEFQFLSFGDGSGFWTTGGTPFPSKQ